MAYSIAIWQNTPDTWSQETKSSTVLNLVKVDGSFKTISELNEFEDVALTEPLTKEDFELHGIDNLGVVSKEEWDKLSDFEIYTWTDDDSIPKAKVTVPPYNILDGLEEPKLLIYSENANPVVNTESIPNGQLIKPTGDMRLKMLKKINSMTLTSNEDGNGIVRTVLSVDEGATWRTYNDVSEKFDEINIEDLDSVKQRGITKDIFNTIGEKWNEIITDGKIRFAYYIEQEELSDIAEVDKLEINIDVDGRWKKAIHVTDYDYEYDNENIYVTFKVNGSYKVNYAE